MRIRGTEDVSIWNLNTNSVLVVGSSVKLDATCD